MKLDLMGYVRSDSGSLKSDTIHITGIWTAKVDKESIS